MTPEQLGAMTLADAEALATRLESAARTIRDAMALMGGPAVERAAPVVVPTETGFAIRSGIPSAGPLMTNKGPVVLTPEEQARKAQLRAERLAELPDNIRAIEEANPE